MEESKKGNDIFITQKPASNKISKYISYYYFHKSDDQNYQKNFIFYPNYKHAITVYKNSEVILSNDQSYIKPAKNSSLQTLYSINKDKSIKVSINGTFDKIGIVFNPLGINHFIETPLFEIIRSNFGDFSYFGDELNLILSQVYSESEIEKKVMLLDHFFEKKINPFHEPILKKAVGEIILSNGGIKVSELSEKLNVNRKTLLRLFNKHTFMSVEEYRKMVMFRQAFNFFHQNKEKTNLTNIALFSMYYDQAHFTKHFKSITKEKPNTLLSKVSHLGFEDTYWYFEN